MMPRAAFAVLLLGLQACVFGQASLSTDSPFVGPSTESTSAPAEANADYEVVGAMRIGDKTSLAILNKTTQKSFWVGVGEEAEGFAVVSRNDKTGDVVARYGGGEHTLKMRSANSGQPSTVTSYNPPVTQPAPNGNTGIVPPHIANQNTNPGTQAEQEREARMLVSDLLDIGMQQRKAYEEAQRRAQAGFPPKPPGVAMPPRAQAPSPTPAGRLP